MQTDLLPIIAYGAAVVGVVAYFWIWLRRPKAIRLFNNAGLFFTSLALALLPAVVPDGPISARFSIYLLAALLLALVAQIFAGLRERKRRGEQWDQVDRRGGGA